MLGAFINNFMHPLCTCLCRWTTSLSHKPFRKLKAHELKQEAISSVFLWINICKYEMPNRESKEGFKSLYFYRWLMHSLTTLCTHYAPVCADKLLNFHISLFKNLWHINWNKKPSQVNFLWISICKYGLPSRESKEGFTKFIFL